MLPDTVLYRLQNSSYDYPGAPCLRPLDISLEKGKFYGLIGPNGSGKTTLIHLLAGIRQPTTGSLFFGADALYSLPKSQLAKHIALVPQNFQMEFEYTVEDVVMMGRHPYIPRFGRPSQTDHEVVDTALQSLDISHLRHRYITQLSGGEKQRVLVARALAQNTQVMLLDEATASLDIRHSIDIMRVMQRRVRNEETLVIAAIHDLDLAAAFCDELIVLHNGTIHSSGAVEEIMDSELLRSVFGVETHICPTPWQTAHIQYRYTEGKA